MGYGNGGGCGGGETAAGGEEGCFEGEWGVGLGSKGGVGADWNWGEGVE